MNLRFGAHSGIADDRGTVVRKGKQPWLLDNVVVPFFAGIGFAIRGMYKLTVGWWLSPWLQRKDNRALLNDLERDFYFLVSEAETITCQPGVLPFNYATAEILWGNLFLIVTRGRGEVNVLIAPRHARNQQSELGPTIAVLEGRHYSARDLVGNLSAAGDLLRPRLDMLNAAFSEENYPDIRERIPVRDRSQRVFKLAARG